jgi:selenocysteine lyase/cysteine desulfurase
MSIIYFDNAATSWPKPPEVNKAIQKYLKKIAPTRPFRSSPVG